MSGRSCARTVNDKIQWIGHTSFAHITRGNIKMASNVHGEVDQVREGKSSVHVSVQLCLCFNRHIVKVLIR